MSLPLGVRVRWGEELGRGAWAVVYPGVCEATGRRVAVKAVRRSAVETRPALAAALRREKEALAAARGSERLLWLVRTAKDEERLYFVTPLVPHGSLRAHMRHEGGAMGGARARAYARDAAEALRELHARGWVHRDLKPENLLVGSDGRLVLADMGLARRADTAGGREGWTAAGTPPYRAPECAAGDARQGPASDLWSLGVLLHEMVAGEPPGEDGRLAAGAGDGQLAGLLRVLLDPDPARRPASADEVLRHPWMRAERDAPPPPFRRGLGVSDASDGEEDEDKEAVAGPDPFADF